MDYVSKITKFVIALVLGAIMVGGLLAPTVAGIQDTVGNPKSMTNIGLTDRELYVSDDVSGTHTMSMTPSPDAKVTYDGEEITTPQNGFYIISDGVSVFFNGAYMTIAWEEVSRQYNASWGVDFEITWEDGTATLEITQSGTTTTYTIPYTWIGYRVGEGEGNYVLLQSTWNVHYTGIKDFIAMGYYSTGDNDCYYSLYNGKLILSDNYTGSVNTDSLVSGTTDIRFGHLTINVEEESFTPYIWAVAKEIHGHESAGPAYSMFGVITLLAIVMLVVVAANAIRSKY